jgi:hypothetical protein
MTALWSRPTPTSVRALAIRKQTAPSVILFRHGSQHRPADPAALLKANLLQILGALEVGSIVVIQPDRIRIRALPLIR